MANINLYQSSEDEELKNKIFVLGGSFFWSGGVLLLVLAAFVGLKFFSTSLEHDNTSLAGQISKENSNFGGSDLNRVVDFKARMDESVKNISQKYLSENLFGSIEGDVVKGINLVSLDFQLSEGGQKSVSMEMIGLDYNSIAKQILSFKQNESLSEVVVGDMARSEEGIEFVITANLN